MFRILQFIFELFTANGALSKILKDRWYLIPAFLLIAISLYRIFSEKYFSTVGISRLLRMFFN